MAEAHAGALARSPRPPPKEEDRVQCTVVQWRGAGWRGWAVEGCECRPGSRRPPCPDSHGGGALCGAGLTRVLTVTRVPSRAPAGGAISGSKARGRSTAGSGGSFSVHHPKRRQARLRERAQARPQCPLSGDPTIWKTGPLQAYISLRCNSPYMLYGSHCDSRRLSGEQSTVGL